jgi:uncharacterized RDD family membrane protein YckC
MIQSLRLLVSAATGGNSVYCHTCGAPNDDPAVFCKKCGTALHKTSPATIASPAAFPAGLQYAGFWKRFAAALIDGLIMGALQVILTAVGVIDNSGLTAGPGTEEFDRYISRLFILGGVMFVVQIFYFAIMESTSKQATLGKMVLGIVVTDAEGKRISFGRAIGRNLAKIISTIMLLIGYFMIAFTQKKQGAHDIMADCLVMVKR